MAWTYLLIAGVLEIGWAVGLKYSDGFTRPLASSLTIVAMIASMYLLALAARKIPIGTAYAVWTGIGAAGAFVFGIWLFREPVTAVRIICVTMILAGIVGLRLSMPAAPPD